MFFRVLNSKKKVDLVPGQSLWGVLAFWFWFWGSYQMEMVEMAIFRTAFSIGEKLELVEKLKS